MDYYIQHVDKHRNICNMCRSRLYDNSKGAKMVDWLNIIDTANHIVVYASMWFAAAFIYYLGWRAGRVTFSR